MPRNRIADLMQWTDLITALGLAAVLEGLLYAAFPEAMRKAMAEFMALPVEMRRATGIGIALFGLFLVWMVRG